MQIKILVKIFIIIHKLWDKAIKIYLISILKIEYISILIEKYAFTLFIFGAKLYVKVNLVDNKV